MEPEKDVKAVAPSPTNDEVIQEAIPKDVNKEEDTSPPPETQETPEDVTPSTPEVKDEVVDDRPIENVAWETKRKIDELYPMVNELKTLMQQKGQEQTGQPQYSKAQLQAYAVTPETNTEQRLWAYSEIEKMEKVERTKEYQEIMRSTQEKSTADMRRNQAVQWVASAFPDMVVKDSSGNPQGWNQTHPVLRKANEYIARSKPLQDDPDGFAAAVKMAAFDMGVSSNKKLSQKVDRTVGQLRKEQKKQLASAGGTRSAETPETASKARLVALQEEYRKTSSREVFAEIIKLKGMNPYV